MGDEPIVEPMDALYGDIRLVGAAEIRDMLGVKRQRTYQITSRDDFPQPVADLCAGKIWLRDDVEEWIRLHRSWLPPRPARGN